MAEHSAYLHVKMRRREDPEGARRRVSGLLSRRWPNADFSVTCTGNRVVQIHIYGPEEFDVSRTRVSMREELVEQGEVIATLVAKPDSIIVPMALDGAAPPTNGGPPKHVAATQTAPVVPKPAVTDPAVITEGILYLMSQRKQPRTTKELATRLGCPEDAVKAVLESMSHDGLVAGTEQTVFTLTPVGAEKASRTEYRGGRKAIVEALLAASGHRLTVYDLAELLGCTLTVPKDSIRLLIQEEMVVEQADKEKRKPGQRGRLRTLFGLTDKAIEIGHDYVPPASLRAVNGWGRPGVTRLAVVTTLVEAEKGALLQANDIVARTGAPLRSVNKTLEVGHDAGFLKKEVVVEAPLTFGYSLTEGGREPSVAYVDEHRPMPFASGQPPADAVVLRVIFQGDTNHVAGLLKRLNELCEAPGAEVAVWSQ